MEYAYILGSVAALPNFRIIYSLFEHFAIHCFRINVQPTTYRIEIL